ncbi:hypothetical protein CDV36_016214 [Fusarium kuroshium]|uniref:DUF7703 domain-containing protein n=3 Tax=Fusarium solani species complex TaxID=232080 RepID=A0A3M2QX60_9HYPO|nr:hypothetical protein CDV36_016214 [Fusarium kuroshium]
MTFERRKSLYFWSFLAATNGIAPHAIRSLLKNILYSDDFILYVTLISVGWVMMVTGQSLVLTMIVTTGNAVILHILIIVLVYGSNSSPSNPWAHPYMIYEKIQVTVFFL